MYINIGAEYWWVHKASALNPPAAFSTYTISNDVIKKSVTIITVEFKSSSQPGREIHDILYMDKPPAPFIHNTLFPLLPINTPLH